MESVRGASQKQDFQPGFLELAWAAAAGGLVLFSAVFFLCLTFLFFSFFPKLVV